MEMAQQQLASAIEAGDAAKLKLKQIKESLN